MTDPAPEPSRPDLPDHRAFAAARAATFEWIAHLLLVEVDEAMLDELSATPIPTLLERLEPGAATELNKCRGDVGAREQIDAEFCRLFIVPGPEAVSALAPVWAREGADGAVHDRVHGLVAGWRSALGVEPDDDGPWGNLPQSHLSVLLGLHALAVDRPDLQREIERDALLPYGIPFARALSVRSKSPTYRAVGKLLLQWLEQRDETAG